MTDSETTDRRSSPLATYADKVMSLLKKGDTRYAHSGATDGAVFDLHDPAAPEVATDCSGWVHDVMKSVAPLHDAVLQQQKYNPSFNTKIQPYEGKAFNPLESKQGWAQADVIQSFFGQKAQDAGFKAGPGTGFKTVDGIAKVEAGDVIAYSTGIYTDPANPDAASNPLLVKTDDTGHAMIAEGAAKDIWSNHHFVAGAADARETGDLDSFEQGMSPDVVKVYAVRVCDSSVISHTDDSAPAVKHSDGSFKSTRNGVGEGTIWFGTDKDGQVIQTRFSQHTHWTNIDPTAPADAGASATPAHALSLSIGRMTDTIDLSKVTTDPAEVPQLHGDLVVNVDKDAQPALDGTNYAAREVLTGKGNLRVQGGGTLNLDGDNSFVGYTSVKDAGTRVAVRSGAGLGQDGNRLYLGAGTTLDLTANMDFHHDVDLRGDAAIDVSAGALVQVYGAVGGDAKSAGSELDVKGGGEIVLRGQAGTIGDAVVHKGTTLTVASDVQAGDVTLKAGAELRIDKDVTLDSLKVSGTSSIYIEKGDTLTVSSASAARGASLLNVNGGGTLVVAQGGKDVTVHGGDAYDLKTQTAGTQVDDPHRPVAGSGASAMDDGNLLRAQAGPAVTVGQALQAFDLQPASSAPSAAMSGPASDASVAGGRMIAQAMAGGFPDGSIALDHAATQPLHAVGIVSPSHR